MDKLLNVWPGNKILVMSYWWSQGFKPLWKHHGIKMKDESSKIAPTAQKLSSAFAELKRFLDRSPAYFGEGYLTIYSSKDFMDKSMLECSNWIKYISGLKGLHLFCSFHLQDKCADEAGSCIWGLLQHSSGQDSAPSAGGTGSIPGQKTNIPHAEQCSQKKERASVSRFILVLSGSQLSKMAPKDYPYVNSSP